MAINPTRAEARLNKTKAALASINALDSKIKGWLEDQDQRQVQVTLLENQISDLKTNIIHAPPDQPEPAENAPILMHIDNLEKEKAQIVVTYGETSKLLNEAIAEVDKLRRANPFAGPAALAAQEAALARKQAAYLRLLLRHLYKCKAHGWTDARMAKLTEHRANLRAARKALEPVEEKIVTADLADIEARVLATTPTEQLAEALRQ